MNKKFQIITSLLLFILFIGIGALWKESVKQRRMIKSTILNITKEYGLFDEQEDIHKNDMENKYKDFFGNIIKSDYTSSPASEKNLSKMREYCKFIIEESIDIFEVSEAYDCLSNLDFKGNDLVSILSAINHSSSSLENMYNSNFAKNLADRIISGHQDEVERIISKNRISFAFDDLSSGSAKKEVPILNAFAKSESIDLKIKALYRLSMIYNFGRSSSEDDKNIDLIKSAEFQKQAFELANITPSKQTDIALVFNDNYVTYGLTTIASILLNSDFNNKYNFYVVMDAKDPVSPKGMKKIEKLKSLRDFNIKYVNFPENVIEENYDLFKFHSDRLPRLVHFRPFMHYALSNLDSVISLDVDIIVRRDLFDLKKPNEIKDKLFAAALDHHSILYSPDKRPECPIEDYRKYVNAGILVINLKNMRTFNSTEKAKKRFAESKCKTPPLNEQDILNIAFPDEKYHLSARWNTPTDIYHNKYNKKFMHFISHFIGAEKPYSPKSNNRPENIDVLSEEHSLWWHFKDLVDYTVNENIENS